MQVFAIWLYPAVSLYFYFVAKAIGKLSVYGTILAYLADCTTVYERTDAFGYASATIYLALAVGPALNLLNPHTAFMFACIGSFINILFVLTLMPETKPQEMRLPSPHHIPEDKVSGRVT